MITEHDLQEAIAECQGQRNPNASTCIKLAAFYIIRKELFGADEQDHTGYSYAPPPAPTLTVEGESDFLEVVNGKDSIHVFSILDELMDALQVLQPRMYESVMRKLKGVGRRASPIFL